MKQCELAKQLGISKSYLSMILSGQRKANPEMAMKISSLFFVNSEAKLSLTGRFPKPLDECATLAAHRDTYRTFYDPTSCPHWAKCLSG